MDPITAAVISLVVWFVIRSAVTVIIVWGGFIGSGLLAAGTNKAGLGILGIAVTIIGALVWEVIAIVQIVLDIIRVIQLVGAGA